MTRGRRTGTEPTLRGASPRFAAGWGLALCAWLVGACIEPAPFVPVIVAPPPPHLVVRTDPASAADCPHGGSVILSGVDGNTDGILQDAEVTARTVVCSPAPVQPPPPIVLRMVAEPPGAHCSAGGTAVESGPDQNGNGRLDDTEVAHIDYACGEVLLTRLAAEPAGPRCIVGGVELLAGRDRDGDGALDDAEIETHDLQCGDVLAGDVLIRSASDAAALASIRVITGNILAGGVTLTSLSLPHLEHVGGQLEVFVDSEISLPALREVDGKLSINGGDAIEVPALRRVGSLDLHFMHVSDLGGFSALTEVDGDVMISEMSTLAEIDLSSLAIRGNLDIFFNDHLARIALKLVDRVGAVGVTDCAALQMLDLSVTGRTTGSGEIGGVDLFSNPVLGRVALSADRVRSFDASDDPAIRDISFDVAKFDFNVSMFRITTAFDLTLSSPSPDGIEFGDGLIISSALAHFRATVPVTVDGLCVFDSTELQTLDLRSTMRVHDLRLSDNLDLTEVSPITLIASLQVIDNARLRSLSFVSPAVPGEIGAVVVTDNPALESAPSLASLVAVHGSVDIERNPLLATVFGPSLVLVDGTVGIVDNAGLTELQLSGLRHLESVLLVQSNASLRFLEMPALTEVTDRLFIFTNPQLRHIGFDALAHVAFFGVDDNPHLPACQVLAVFAHVTSRDASQSGNDNTATCP